MACRPCGWSSAFLTGSNNWTQSCQTCRHHIYSKNNFSCGSQDSWTYWSSFHRQFSGRAYRLYGWSSDQVNSKLPEVQILDFVKEWFFMWITKCLDLLKLFAQIVQWYDLPSIWVMKCILNGVKQVNSKLLDVQASHLYQDRFFMWTYLKRQWRSCT